ncbi:MAG: hypothetical protein EOR00_33260, partial [Mesorhizobium sp.]
RPPLSCRTSPPLGGRSAASPSRPTLSVGDWRKRRCRPISPQVGEMPGREEGGAVPPISGQRAPNPQAG